MHLGSHSLLESLLWTPAEGFWLLDLHLERLQESARFFGVPLDGKSVRRRLETLSKGLGEPVKVRLLVAPTGELDTKSVPLAAGAGALEEPVRIGMAREPVSSANPWLYHKTSNRSVYESARRSRPDLDDVLLFNERGELTEASSSNVVVVVDGRRWTPPRDAGLLAGTLRRDLLQRGEIGERTILIEELSRADEVYLINSVRKWRRTRVMP